VGGPSGIDSAVGRQSSFVVELGASEVNLTRLLASLASSIGFGRQVSERRLQLAHVAFAGAHKHNCSAAAAAEPELQSRRRRKVKGKSWTGERQDGFTFRCLQIRMGASCAFRILKRSRA